MLHFSVVWRNREILIFSLTTYLWYSQPLQVSHLND
jgi:hypothetical protein